MISPSPGRFASSLARRLRLRANPGRIRALTGASREEWREIARAFPALPRDPGPAAARARLRLARRWTRALETGRWRVRLDGEAPSPAPAVYVTAHVGSLQALRYALRARGVPAATVLGPFNLDRTRALRDDRIFDARHALDFPHALAADRPHRLRTALASGSLILAADLPPAGAAGTAAVATVLGGRVALDARPLRLARATRVPCRAAFLTLPREGWTLTLSPPLAGPEAAALAELARTLERVMMRAPLDLDGTVYRALARGAR
jgi:hypothetical protein